MRGPRNPRLAEAGFTLVGLIVAIFLVLLVLGVAAPRVAKALRREREVEAVHRGQQYVRAIQLYYRKLGHYPGSLDQLDKTNNIRFLRQHYADPMTGKADWRLIHVGEAKTTVKGFFGKPLTGLPSAGGLGSGIGGSVPGQAPVGTSGSSAPSAFGGAPQGSTPGGTGAGSGGGSGLSSQSATSFQGTGGPIMGVSSLAGGSSILTLNEQTTYATWEFLYDPRIEQMRAQTGLTSGSPVGTGLPGFGSGGGAGNSGNGSPNPPPTAPPGTTPLY